MINGSMSRLLKDKKSNVVLKGISILHAHFTAEREEFDIVIPIFLKFNFLISYLNDLYKGKVEAPVLRWSGGTGYKRACA